jgi:hypothetical protein
MSAWVVFQLIAVATMPFAYNMARSRGRSTNAWLSWAMLLGPFALLALLVLGTPQAGPNSN